MFYDEMTLLCKGDVATGQYAKDTSEPLAQFAAEEETEGNVPMSEGPVISMGSKEKDKVSTSRKRHKETLAVMDKIRDKLQGLLDAFERRHEELNKRAKSLVAMMREFVDEEFKGVVFTKDDLVDAADYLVEHPSICELFVERDAGERKIWIYKFLTRR